ncbi:hypothetical protein GEMRC1_004390 [Eukaryota sp. GEM-RC1]
MSDAFDYVFLGTSPALAYAAFILSSQGKSCCIVDASSTYGGWSSSLSPPKFDSSTNSFAPTFSSFKHLYHSDSFPPRFCRTTSVDLVPTTFPCNSISIDLIRDHNLSQHFFFSSPSSISVRENSTFTEIPMSGHAVFRSKSLTPRQKRSMVKLIQSITIDNQSSESDHTSWFDFLSKFDLPDLVLNSLTFALPYPLLFNQEKLLVNHDLNDVQSSTMIEAISSFVKGSHRFSSESPFLLNMYGSSEFSQVFSRGSAVNGSVFLLNTTSNLIEDQDLIKLQCEVEGAPNEISFKYLIFDQFHCPYVVDNQISSKIGRICLISKIPLITNDILSSFLFFKFENLMIFGMQYDHLCTKNVPKDHYLIYFWCHFPVIHDDEIVQKMESFLNNLINEIEPIWGYTFVQNLYEKSIIKNSDRNNILSVFDSPLVSSFDQSISIANELLEYIKMT